jgi:UDP-N-acetylmuramoyl-tripeptide--D-alanyl-D-alanine ligase
MQWVAGAPLAPAGVTGVEMLGSLNRGSSPPMVDAVRWSSRAAADVLGAHHVGDDVVFDGCHFDSRTVRPGSLFVPVVAQRNGHDFISAAVAGGATAYLSSTGPRLDVPAACIDVPDTVVALQQLAAASRAAFTGPVVGITGSVGKTSTKDFTAAALAAAMRTHANTGSFNNELGLPVTMLGAPDGTEALVVEMGMRGFGQIAQLCAIARPNVAVVTKVSAGHTELVGSIDGVATAKAELIDALPSVGVAILNADDERVTRMSLRTEARVLTYGFAGEVRIERVVLDELARPSMQLGTPWGRCTLTLSASGAHQGHNAVGALAVALSAGVALDDAVNALARVQLTKWRMEISRSANGALVINDAYNANPESMCAALASLAATSVSGRRIAVIGPMAELGDEHVAGHQAVVDVATRLGIELVAVGTGDYGIDPIDFDAAKALIEHLGTHDGVLVKASRSAGLERLLLP